MYVMNKYKWNFSATEIISESPEGNDQQMEVEDISKSNEADGMHDEKSK